MLWLAVKTLLHEKVRFFITLLGITVAGVLALIEIAIYLGMMANATAVIRHTDADIWVASKNIQSFDFALPFPAERINKVRAFADVLWAEKLLLSWGFIKLANGGREQVQIIGYNPDSGIGRPWAMLEGVPADVKGGNYMILDKTSEQRLGHLATGTRWEVSFGNKEHSLKLVGLSQGIKSFTTAPVAFTSYNELSGFFADAGWGDQTAFIVAKLKDPAAAHAVASALKSALRDNDVYTRDEFIRKTVMYWTVQTGMGMAFFLTAALAMIIGGTVVGQTIYASTLEHLREYGTLKAIGAKNREIYQVVFAQAGINAVAGYAIAAVVVLLLKGGIEKAGVPLALSPTLFVALFFAILTACMASAWFSVGKIRSLDPVSVFKA
jgi:putative ABC transport system permease protein